LIIDQSTKGLACSHFLCLDSKNLNWLVSVIPITQPELSVEVRLEINEECMLISDTDLLRFEIEPTELSNWVCVTNPELLMPATQT